MADAISFRAGPKAFDHTGARFGRLVALSRAPSKKRGRWLCRCDCGSEKDVNASMLTLGVIKSCGCLRREDVARRKRTHGQSKTPTWKAWSSMRERCLNPQHHAYANYGGRRIRICERWLESFENFLADMGERPAMLTLERLDVNGDYSPANCVWADRKAQQRNTRVNRRLTYDGQTLPISQWAETKSISEDALRKRISNGWSVERALTTPIRGRAQQ